MAQRIDYDSGCYFVGNPILYKVQADSVSGQPVFHRIVLEVTASLKGENSTAHVIATTVIKMSQSVISGEEALIDISSALKSVLDGYKYEATPPNYPLRIAYTLRAWDEYMIDGVVHDEKNGHVVTHGGSTVYPGRLSDRERLAYAEQKKDDPEATISYRGKNKPTDVSAEIVCAGHVYMGPAKASTPPFTISSSKIPEGTSTSYRYALPSSTPDCYEVRFVNRYGCHEYVCLHSLRSAEVKYDVEDYTVARQETLTEFSRGIVRKKNDRETWRISTFPLDQAWQQWFLHEFLPAEWSWIKINGMWLQVHIIPEETVTSIDRASGKPLTVDFSLRFDIAGSPFNL